MSYEFMKFLHLIGVVLLVGNVTITAFWKVFADRTGDAQVVAYAQHLVTLCDWIFTLSGIVMIVAGGYGMAYVRDYHAFEDTWLILGQLLFLVSRSYLAICADPSSDKACKTGSCLKPERISSSRILA